MEAMGCHAFAIVLSANSQENHYFHVSREETAVFEVGMGLQPVDKATETRLAHAEHVVEALVGSIEEVVCD